MHIQLNNTSQCPAANSPLNDFIYIFTYKDMHQMKTNTDRYQVPPDLPRCEKLENL